MADEGGSGVSDISDSLARLTEKASDAAKPEISSPYSISIAIDRIKHKLIFLCITGPSS